MTTSTRDKPSRVPFELPRYRWPSWHKELKRFQQGDWRKAAWQIANTFIPYLAIWYLMAKSIALGYPYSATLLLAIPASGLLVRIFILFHDCVHNSFFASSRANTILGYLFGTLVFTPLEDWRFTHLRHHVSYANLDARGVGDITTLTVSEYKNSSCLKRLQYRLYRNPMIMFAIGPLFYFLLRQRWPSRAVSRKARKSVLLTNILITAVIVTASVALGFRTYLMIQLPILWLGGAGGIWLFYVQHQFEGVYWARRDAWDPLRAAMDGSSFYRLPTVLRWFSASIGIHFIHHLGARIPNYNLMRCYEAIPELHSKKPLTLRKSLLSPKLKLWDEAQQRLVGFP